MIDYAMELIKRIKGKKISIGVIGLGYVGLPLALEFAGKGVNVIGFEIDGNRLEHLRKKRSYISDISDSQLKRAMAGGHFSATDNFSLLNKVDAVLICVPTPLKGKFLPNISFILEAIKSAVVHLKKGALVVLESTTYPGTTEEEILPILESKGLVHGEDFYLCFSPERIDPGNKKFPVNKIPKVIGGINEAAGKIGAALYGLIIEKVVLVSSTRAAESVKLLENTFRLVNIGLIDELAMMAHKMNIDIWEVVNAAATKPFGFMPFYPGPGVGGHCIPKDPLYLYWKAKHFGFRSRFIKLASDVINYMPVYVVDRVIKLLVRSHALTGAGKSQVTSKKILVIGATYKKDVKDLRKSPSLDIIDNFKKKGAVVSYYDPLIPYLKINGLDLKSIDLTAQSLRKFDCVVISTDHSNIDYDFVLKNAKLIFDARNVYKHSKNKKVIVL